MRTLILAISFLCSYSAAMAAEISGVFIDNQSFCQILYQLIYLLPIDATLKQRLLEIPEGADRAVILHAELIRLGVIQYIKPEAGDG